MTAAPPSAAATDAVAAIAAAAGDLMLIEDVTDGVGLTDKAPGQAVRLRGRLLIPADEAWPRLAALPVTFRPARARPAIALLMFTLTILSCLFVGAQMAEGAGLNLLAGWPFALSLLAILAAHEFGHYLVARRLGSPTSLPYFIPMPFGPFGTLGAFITMSVPPRNRRHLLAIGAAGPLAGLVVAVPVLILGLSLSKVLPLPPGGYQMEGNSLLYAGLKLLMFGRLLPAGGEDVWIHPVAFAGWAGLLVTALNLIPAGQLDGGHIAYALLGPQGARRATWAVLAALVGLSFLWTGWALWLALVFFFGRMQDMPLDEVTELTVGQRALAAAMVVIFALVFVPIPLVVVP